MRNGEITVRDLQEKLDLEQPTASQHLAALRARDLVVTRRDGTSVWYRVADSSIWNLLDIARDIYERQLVKHQASFEALR